MADSPQLTRHLAGLHRLLSEANYPPPVVVVFNHEMSPEETARFRDEWVRASAGVIAARPIFLPEASLRSNIELEPTPTGADELVSLLTLEHHACLP